MKTPPSTFFSGLPFCKSLIAAPLQRFPKSRFERIEVAALTNLIGEIDMSKRFPVGGSRQAVYSFMHHNGFQMSGWSDKVWTRFDGVEASIYGAGSMCRITKDGKLIEDGELDKVVRASSYAAEEHSGGSK
jgi:hypothetical protein